MSNISVSSGKSIFNVPVRSSFDPFMLFSYSTKQLKKKKKRPYNFSTKAVMMFCKLVSINPFCFNSFTHLSFLFFVSVINS